MPGRHGIAGSGNAQRIVMIRPRSVDERMRAGSVAGTMGGPGGACDNLRAQHPQHASRRRTPMPASTHAKIYPDAANALAGVVRDGITVMSGGFGLCGIPENL